MANSYQHTLESRASLLSSAITRKVSAISTGITPPGSRPPFTQTMGKEKALDTILTNWKLPATQSWIAGMDPQSQLELHNALSQHILEKGYMNATAQPNGMSMGGGMEQDKASSMSANSFSAPNFGAIRNLA